MKTTEFVLGFAFSQTMRSVVLIEKNRPAWQAGKLNGVGGHKAHEETNFEAMVREFREETGAQTHIFDWIHFHTMRFQNGNVVYCFATKLPVGTPVNTMEDEFVDVYPVIEDGLISEFPVIANLRWLIPMAYHELKLPIEDRMML